LHLVRNLFTRDRSVVLAQPGRRTALLVLPGFGMLGANWQQMARAFAGAGDVDVYLPDYFARESVAACAGNLHTFVQAHDLHRYERLHAFAYILGGWVLNTYLRQHSLPHLHTVIYDRSPIQDRAPRTITDLFPRLARLVMGHVLQDLAHTPYPPLPRDDVRIGLMIENDVTSLMRVFKRHALALRPLTWEPEQFGQPHDDACYVPLNHDEMYRRFDVFMGEARHFYAHGSFRPAARRTPYTQEPF
jgi:hypothetical protein